MADSPKGLIPTEDEIRQILAQTLINNPSRYPVVALQIEFACLMARYFDKLYAEYNASANKMVNKFQAKVDEFSKKMVDIIENKRDK